MSAPPPTSIFERAFRVSEGAFALVRGDGCELLDVNDAWCRLMSVARDDALGKPLASLAAWAQDDDVHTLCGRLARGAPIRDVHLAIVRMPHDQPADLSATAIPLGEDAVTLLAFRDVTEEERTLERRGRLHRLEELGRLAGGIAHDFNNLLTVVHAYAQMIRSAAASGRRVEAEDAEEIARAVDRGRVLTQHLLAFTRNRQVERRLVDVNAALRSLAGMLRPLLGGSIALDQYLWSSVPPILADPVQLDQVVMNLVINACDAMPEGGRISLATQHILVREEDLALDGGLPAPGEFALIQVSDTGHGMDDETRERIFEPFFTTKGEGTGTGVGLAVVSGIVRQARGAIRVRSAIGRGTTVAIYWPVATPLDDVAVRGSSSGQPRTCVMVVEDDTAVRQTIRRLLDEAGFESASARDGREAIQMLRHRWSPGSGPAVVLAGVGTPDMGGRELAFALAEQRPDLPLVLMSPCDNGDQLARALPNVRVPVLHMPFANDELVARIRDALELSDTVNDSSRGDGQPA